VMADPETHDVTTCVSIEREKRDTSCYNIMRTWEEERETSSYNMRAWYRFTSFCLNARFNNDHNIKLALVLTHRHSLSIKQASRKLGVSRSLIYKIIQDNPCFDSDTRPTDGWGSGGRERWIILSKVAKKFSQQIQEFAKLHLGEDECAKLLSKLNPVKPEVIERSVEAIRRNPGNKTILKERSRITGLPPEKLLELAAGGRP